MGAKDKRSFVLEIWATESSHHSTKSLFSFCVSPFLPVPRLFPLVTNHPLTKTLSAFENGSLCSCNVGIYESLGVTSISLWFSN